MAMTQRRALLIGAEEYSSARIPNIRFCHSDAQLLADTLTSECDYFSSNVRVLKLAPGDDITPDEILKNVEDIVNESGEGDTILFYFAGHGMIYNESPYIILPDTDIADIPRSAISLKKIADLVSKKKCVNIRIFDACQSGAEEREAITLGLGGFVRGALVETAAEGWMTFAGCKEDEACHGIPALSHGVFTYYLSEAIKNSSAGAPIYPENLKLVVCEKVKEWAESSGFKQTPTLKAALSGNIDIATKKIPPPSVNRSTTSSLNPMSVDERLAKFQNVDFTWSEKNMAVWPEMIKHGKEALENAVSSYTWNFSEIAETINCNASYMPPHVKNILVPAVRQKRDKIAVKIDTQKRYKRESEWERQMRRTIAGMSSIFQANEPELIGIDHHIDEGDFIDGFSMVKLYGNNVMMNSVLFLWFVPLQLGYSVFCGANIQSDRYNDTWENQELKQCYLSLENYQERIDTLINDVVDQFARYHVKAAAATAEYLEKELSNIN